QPTPRDRTSPVERAPKSRAGRTATGNQPVAGCGRALADHRGGHAGQPADLELDEIAPGRLRDRADPYRVLTLVDQLHLDESGLRAEDRHLARDAGSRSGILEQHQGHAVVEIGRHVERAARLLDLVTFFILDSRLETAAAAVEGNLARRERRTTLHVPEGFEPKHFFLRVGHVLVPE